MRAILPVCALLGCSVLGLDDFERCDELGDTIAEQEAACARGLNEEFGFPESCRPFRCVDGECVLERETERCDGADNDCDSAVDESVFAPSGFASVQYGEPPAFLSVAASGNEARAFWSEARSGEAATAALAPLVGEVRSTVTYARHRDGDADGVDEGSLTEIAFEEGCWQREIVDALGTRAPQVRTSDCNIDHVVAASAASRTFAAVVGTRECPEGRLRFAEVREGTRLRVAGPLGRSNSFLGVGLTEDGMCSAARPRTFQQARDALVDTGSGDSCTDACPSGEECVCGRCVSPAQALVLRECGFTNIAVDAISTPRGGSVEAHALVAGVGGARSAECVLDVPRPVALWGGFIQGSGDLSVVNATDEGTPLIVGETTGVGAPAVAGAGEVFVVAYPNLTGGADVAIVGPLDEPSPTDPTRCESGVEVACGTTTPQQSRCQFTTCGSDVGVCTSGEPRCENGISFCVGVREPNVIEQCDNELDDDCDGRTDEADCGSCAASVEVCNAIDDDCDGSVDEDVADTLDGAPEGAPCGTEMGVCEAGIVACRGGKLLCAGGVIPRTSRSGNPTDLCGNGEDDDCDGRVDESACDACVPASPPRETCDGQDDDCDGRIDETRVVGPACSLMVACPDGMGLSCIDGMCAEAAQVPARGDDPEEIIQPPMSRPLGNVRECVAIGALPAPMSTTVSFIASGLDNFALAPGGSTDDSLTVALAWTEEDGTRVGVRVLTFDARCQCRDGSACSAAASCERVVTPTALRDAGTPSSVSPEEGAYGPPTIAYASTGFRAEGDTGGWFVLWTDRNARQVFGARVAADGSVLDAAFAAGRDPSSEDLPAAFGLAEGVGYAYADRAAGEIVTARMQCPAPTPEE
ncbi:MAG: MopE-related protein [Myxococcota bacterium]